MSVISAGHVSGEYSGTDSIVAIPYKVQLALIENDIGLPAHELCAGDVYIKYLVPQTIRTYSRKRRNDKNSLT